MGKVEDRHSGGGRDRKRGLARNLGVAWGCLFFMVKTPVNHMQKGTPYGVGVHVDETGIAEEEVIGKEGLQETM